MKRYSGMILGGIGLVAVLLGMSSVYTVSETQQALVLQFGEPIRPVTEPGLHFKLPVQNIAYIDKRVLYLNLPEEEIITQDRKRLIVDAFARWRIVDPLRFYQSLTNQTIARLRLQPILASNVRQVLGARDFAAVLSGERADMMVQIRNGMNAETPDFGIEFIDVRIRRADLPPENSLAIYQRMQQERFQEASEFRAVGERISLEIRSAADRDATIIVAEATRESEIMRGEGEAERARVFAAAFGRDPDFFAFYRSMKAYEVALRGDNTTIVLSPNSEFFRYFGDDTP